MIKNILMTEASREFDSGMWKWWIRYVVLQKDGMEISSMFLVSGETKKAVEEKMQAIHTEYMEIEYDDNKTVT